MRIISFFTLFFLVIACNNAAKQKEDTKDTAKQDIQIPATPQLPDTIFTGFGTEPFWSVYVVANSKIVFHPADGPDVEVPYVPLSLGVNSSQYNSDSGNSSIHLSYSRKDCSDGMSGEIHPYEVLLVVNKTKYSGCGRDRK